MFMLKCSWLWSLLPNGLCITTLSTNSFCEDSTISNTLPALVGSNTCWVKKLSCTRHKNFWSSTPVLCCESHLIFPCYLWDKYIDPGHLTFNANISMHSSSHKRTNENTNIQISSNKTNNIHHSTVYDIKSLHVQYNFKQFNTCYMLFLVHTPHKCTS